MFAVTAEGRQAGAMKGRPVVLPGHAADAPGNDYLAPGRMRVAPDGMLAAGHPVGGELIPGHEGLTQHLDFQQVTPGRGADLTQVAGNPGPLADAVIGHGRAHVATLDQARASNPGLAPQLGPRMPGPVPGQPQAHTAPTGAGAQFRVSPAQAASREHTALYLPGPRGAS